MIIGVLYIKRKIKEFEWDFKGDSGQIKLPKRFFKILSKIEHHVDKEGFTPLHFAVLMHKGSHKSNISPILSMISKESPSHFW